MTLSTSVLKKTCIALGSLFLLSVPQNTESGEPTTTKCSRSAATKTKAIKKEQKQQDREQASLQTYIKQYMSKKGITVNNLQKLQQKKFELQELDAQLRQELSRLNETLNDWNRFRANTLHSINSKTEAAKKYKEALKKLNEKLDKQPKVMKSAFTTDKKTKIAMVRKIENYSNKLSKELEEKQNALRANIENCIQNITKNFGKQSIYHSSNLQHEIAKTIEFFKQFSKYIIATTQQDFEHIKNNNAELLTLSQNILKRANEKQTVDKRIEMQEYNDAHSTDDNVHVSTPDASKARISDVEHECNAEVDDFFSTPD